MNSRLSQTQGAQQNAQRNIVFRQDTSTDGKPLDFSFKNLKSLEDLRNCDPRSGKRKEPPKDEEDNKEEIKKAEVEEEQEQKQNENEELSQKEEESGEGEGEKQDQSENNQNGNQKQKGKKKKKKKPENKQPQVIRIIPSNNQNTLLASSQLPVGGQNKGGVGKVGFGEDSKGQSSKYVIKINLVCSSLILSYNKIRSLQNFKQCIDYVMFDNWKDNLCWIDLSHNYLEKLDYDFSDVPNLKSLYLHCNYISDLSDLFQLQELPLRTLTIHGNPVETINNFRLYIIGILPHLKRLDSVLISKKERDNCKVWIDTFKYKSPPCIKDPTKPPQENQPQNAQKQ